MSSNTPATERRKKTFTTMTLVLVLLATLPAPSPASSFVSVDRPIEVGLKGVLGHPAHVVEAIDSENAIVSIVHGSQVRRYWLLGARDPSGPVPAGTPYAATGVRPFREGVFVRQLVVIEIVGR